jgi:Ca-activated chloride channel homolog
VLLRATSIGRLCAVALAMGASGLLATCDRPEPTFRLIAGSEQRVLEPVVIEFCRSKRVDCRIDYTGSLEIGLMLTSNEPPPYDAIWPADSLWVEMFDTQARVEELKPTRRSGLALGVRTSKARELGWIETPPSMTDIVEASSALRLRAHMTSVTQSGSGMFAYLGMLASEASPRAVLDEADFVAAGQGLTREALRLRAPSPQSSGWLGEAYLRRSLTAAPPDAMWNYDFVLADVDRELRAKGEEGIVIVRPAEGAPISDAPLGRLNGGAQATFFRQLQAHLAAQQTEVQAPPLKEFAIQQPELETIRRALGLYADRLRTPVTTLVCVDITEATGQAHRERLQEMFAPEAREKLIHWGARDRIILLPFGAQVEAAQVTDASPEGLRDLRAALLTTTSTEDRAQPVACASEALRLSGEQSEGSVAVIVVSDATGDPAGLRWSSFDAPTNRDPPIFIATSTDEAGWAKVLSTETGGRVFTGADGVGAAFRSALGGAH